MTTLEKTIIGIMVVCILVFIGSVYSCNRVIDEAGGLKQIFIETGRQIEDIKKEIENE